MVRAPPEDGRANEALLRLLAREWRLPRRDLSIVAGAASRYKTVHVAGDPRQLADRLAVLIAAEPGR
jgi:uncharacterized protein YggU (UPF0235/DUF167 family)